MAEIVKDMDNDTGPGWLHEWSDGPAESGIAAADSTGNWREGKDKTDVVLGIARKGLLIGPVYLHGDDAEFVKAWNALAEADRRQLLESTRPDRGTIDIALKLAGSSYEEAHKMVAKKNTSQTVKNLTNWRQGRDAAIVVLQGAHAAKLISELALPESDSEFVKAWVELSDRERGQLLTFRGLDEDVIRVACELAGHTYKDPRIHLVDTPETRAAARRKMGL